MQNSMILDWRFKSKQNLQRKETKKAFARENLEELHKIFEFSQEKIHLMRIQMTRRNGKFNGQFNDIRLKIQIEAKIADENKQETYFKDKICLNDKKFDNLSRENLLNENSNDTDKCRIEW